MNGRELRVGGAVKETVAEVVLKELRDPRLARVTITGVKMSRDLKWATVYFTAFGDERLEQEALAALKGATGFIKRRLAHHLKLRFMPELRFAADEAQKTEARIDKLLKGEAIIKDFKRE